MGTVSSVWIGYGCKADEVFWTEAFEAWWMEYQADVPLLHDLWVLMVAVATTTKAHAEFLGIMELPFDTVFRLEQVTDGVPVGLVQQAVQSWEQLRRDAGEAGFVLPTGQWLFAHLMD